MARDRLEREFGLPCIIAEACEQRLKGSSAVKSNDPESLKGFSKLLEKTLISLKNIRSLLRQHKLTGHHEPSVTTRLNDAC